MCFVLFLTVQEKSNLNYKYKIKVNALGVFISLHQHEEDNDFFNIETEGVNRDLLKVI